MRTFHRVRQIAIRVRALVHHGAVSSTVRRARSSDCGNKATDGERTREVRAEAPHVLCEGRENASYRVRGVSSRRAHLRRPSMRRARLAGGGGQPERIREQVSARMNSRVIGEDIRRVRALAQTRALTSEPPFSLSTFPPPHLSTVRFILAYPRCSTLLRKRSRSHGARTLSKTRVVVIPRAACDRKRCQREHAEHHAPLQLAWRSRLSFARWWRSCSGDCGTRAHERRHETHQAGRGRSSHSW